MSDKKHSRIAILWNNILDFTAPVETWIVQKIYFRFWASYLAKKQLDNLRKPHSFFLRAKSIINSWDKPDYWYKAVCFALIFVFSPIILIELLFITPFIKPTQHFKLDVIKLTPIFGMGWQVLASLIGITFIIVVFLVQYANEKDYERRAFPIFIKETHMIFTASFNLFTILFMGLSLVLLSINSIQQEFLSIIVYYNFALFIINIFLVLIIFISTIRIIIPIHFREKFKQYCSEQTSRFVDIELINRFTRRILQDKFKLIGIDYSFFTPDSRVGKDNLCIKKLSREIQIVTDINIKMLEIAIKRAKKIFPTFSKQDLVYFGNLDHRISEERPEIALITSFLNRPQITNYLIGSIRFSPIEKIGKHTISEEMFLNRDLISSAIQSRQADVVEDLLGQFQTIIKSFLEAIDSYGVHYSLNLAQREDGFFSDWVILSIIQDHYRSLIKKAFECNDDEITRSFITFPFHILANAIRYRDHLVYKRFSELLPVIYRHALSNKDNLKQKSIIDLCSRLMVEHLTYFLISTIKKTKDEEDLEDVEQLTDYLIQLNNIWNQFIKIAIDSKDLKLFQTFASSARQILKKFLPSTDETGIEIRKFQIDAIDESQRQTEISAINFEIKALALKSKIKQIQSIMFLGIGAWLTHLYDIQNMTIEEFKSFSNINKLDFNNIDFLNLIFSDTIALEKAEEQFNWNSWEMREWEETIGDVKFGKINNSSWLLRYYLILFYELLPYGLSALPKLKPTNQSQNILENVKSEMNNLQKNEHWRNLLLSINSDNYEKRIASLISIHENVANEQEIIEETIVVDTPISDEKIELFRKDVLDSWEQNTVIRGVIKKIGRYQEFPGTIHDKEGKVFGIKELSPKGAFIDQNRVTYLDWGSTCGRTLAHSEDHLLGMQINSFDCQSFNSNNFEEILNTCLLEYKSNESTFIILFNGADLMKLLHESKSFIPDWRIDKSAFKSPGFMGLYNQIPVFRFDPIEENSLILIDIKSFGILSQYGISDSKEFPITIRINEITHDQAKTILEKNPEWNKNPKNGGILDFESAIRRILQHVSIQIWEYCILEEINPLYIKKFSLEKPY